MAGRLTVSTLNNDTGPLATQNGMTGVAKAWGSYAFVGTGSAPALNSAFNISSITRTAAGAYTFAFTTPMSNALYAVNLTGSQGNVNSSAAIGTWTTKSTSNFTVQMGYGVFTQYDFGVDFAILGI
jgi:hypothetical protein